MGWIHDTGFGPAYEHEGFTVTVLDDDTETTRLVGADLSGRIAGWRAGCECGWRSPVVYPAGDYPAEAPTYSYAPPAIEAEDGAAGLVQREWAEHLAVALPELAVHDAAQDVAEAQERLETAVLTAREAGISWGVIGGAAGISRQSAHERWAELSRGPNVAGRSPEEIDLLQRCTWARNHNGGHPNRAWSTGEQLAVALVLGDRGHLDAMEYTPAEAARRVADGMVSPPSDMGAWIVGLRADLTDDGKQGGGLVHARNKAREAEIKAERDRLQD